MLRRIGPRTLVEIAFLIAVPAVIAIAGFGAITIIGGSAVAYLLVLAVEIIESREPGYKLRRAPRAGAARPRLVAVRDEPPSGESVRVVPREETTPGSGVEASPEPVPSDPPTAERAAESTTVAAEPKAAPEPERPPLAAAPEPEPAPAPTAPEQSAVVPIGVGAAPRRWNLWQLEELVKASSGIDLTVDEERNYLLLYLRDFADPSGELPLDFDGLVRESFGDLVGAR